MGSRKPLSATHRHLAAEWDTTKNLALGLRIEELTAGSGKKVWWKCAEGHGWEARIYSRAGNNAGCPYCSGRFLCSSSSLQEVHPSLAAEWHCLKNLPVTAGTIAWSSNKKVWWRCSQGHEWQATVNNRSSKGCRCPHCLGRVATSETCLALVNPKLADEWHPTKNQGLSARDVTPGSNKKVWWRCSVGHSWKAKVHHRVSGSSCPKCAGGPVSRASQEWLDSLGIPEEFREYPVKLPGRKRAIRVDGFDPETSTVYEFLGDYWHGNTELYHSEDVNPTSKKTFGALYNQTARRLERLRKVGYRVVFIWEKDFKERFNGKEA